MDVKSWFVIPSRWLILYVLVNVCFVDCEGLAKKSRLSKRQVLEVENSKKCSEINTPDGSGVHKIKDIDEYEYVFFMKPQTDFKSLIFNMEIDNSYDLKEPYIYKDELYFRSQDFTDVKVDTWLEVKAKYYKHVVDNGRDKLALSVTIGKLTRLLVTRKWWRTHAYKGFRISAEGGASFLFDCVTSQIRPNPASGVNKPLLLGGILGICFLLVIAGWIGYLFLRRPRRSAASSSSCGNPPPSIPDLPASLLLGLNKVNKCPDDENIYDEFNEDMLARLRQKMTPMTLGDCRVSGSLVKSPPPPAAADKEEANIYCIPKAIRPCKGDAIPTERRKASGGLDPLYLNEVSNMSLLEEKIKLSGRDSVPESHYVEMHGIIGKRSPSPVDDKGN